MQASLAKTIAAQPQLLGIGIDEATALEVHGSMGSVLGRGHVTIVSRSGQQGLSAGARYDIARRAVL
jgi:cyanophycinase-like exopeptidase